jgi:S-methylmethionine-dependent homocysteine/selenocysteine methylase
MIVLDGGMGRQLARMGAPFGQPEWSALALIEAPEFITRAHREFIDAGADIITTNSYAVVPFHIGEERFQAQGAELLDRAGRLAREVAAGSNVRIAAGIPPLFGSYAPEAFEPDRAPEMLAPFREHLLPYCDLALAETLSSTAEAAAVVAAFTGTEKPLWLSFTLEDADPEPGRPKLRSGEDLADALALAGDAHADAVLFNCSQPEVMADAVALARDTLGTSAAIGVYANAFALVDDTPAANAALRPIRADLTPERYRAFAEDWLAQGAEIIGGCCGVGPEHIAALSALKARAA